MSITQEILQLLGLWGTKPPASHLLSAFNSNGGETPAPASISTLSLLFMQRIITLLYIEELLAASFMVLSLSLSKTLKYADKQKTTIAQSSHPVPQALAPRETATVQPPSCSVGLAGPAAKT